VANEFTRHWFSTFMDTMPSQWTLAEVDGVARRLPLPAHRRVLDVCCGTGRHASLLEARGYDVTGIDRDEAALASARLQAPNSRFIRLDQRDLDRVPGRFDALIVLWQSFGYFDSGTNDRVLAHMAGLLRPGGRLLIDLFHPDHLAATAGATIEARGSPGVRISNVVRDGRLESTIRYPEGAAEVMDFELYSPEALQRRAERAGFSLVEQCCWWEEGRLPDPSVQRYQSVFERR
jgi:D-alanine-D-alanine ligase